MVGDSLAGGFFGDFHQCNDRSSSDDVWCGWALDEEGNHVEFSQGFCCSCSLAQQAGTADETQRGQLDCALFGSGQSSAHCLRLDDLW